MLWSEGQVWTSPERHGAMSAVMKSQIDWIPLPGGAIRPTQGRTLALMQVSGGSQSFNALNQMRILGRWMRMITIPNQSSVAKAWQEFDDVGRMKSSPFYDRVVDVMEELLKFTILTRSVSDHVTDRYGTHRHKLCLWPWLQTRSLSNGRSNWCRLRFSHAHRPSVQYSGDGTRRL